MKATPKIMKFMTTVPQTIGNDIPLKTALSMMKEQRIRHLPVLEGSKLVGMLTDRDIKLAAAFKGSDEMRVDDVMSPDAYSVSPEANLEEVVAEMAEHKYGAAVVIDNKKVVGIFTAIDALKVLSDVLKQNFKH